MPWTYSLHELARAVGAEAPGGDVSFSAVSTDTRTLQPGDVFFALKGENFDGNRFVAQAFEKGAAAAVVDSPHGEGPTLLVRDAQAALQDFAAWHRRRFTLPLLALTGSCGKTSSKDLIASVIGSRHSVVKTQGNLNNEIGCPLSLLRIDAGTDFAVIEMGANHHGEIARLCEVAAPTEAAITLIGPAHLEGFGTIEDVARAKGEIISGLPENGIFYVNTDDPRCVRLAEGFTGELVRFGSTGDVVLADCHVESEEMALDVSPIGGLRLPLLSRAHVSNVLLAIAVGLRHGITEFEAPLRQALLASARMKLRRIGPLRVLDDTYNANPSSMAAAIRTLAEHGNGAKTFAVLGDMLELGEASRILHEELGALAADQHVDYLFARGQFATDTARGARTAGIATAEVIQDHEALAAAIIEAAVPGDIVLVKGSRGMRMERVVDALAKHFESGGR